MECRESCAACCIAPSISSAIPGMPKGKSAGEYCAQLTEDLRCKIFGQKIRPKVCSEFHAGKDVCGENQAQALEILTRWEKLTKL